MKLFLPSFFVVFLLGLSSCSTNSPPCVEEALCGSTELIHVGWLPENQRALDQLIREKGSKSKNYDPEKRPVAVFDWDNTMIANDIGEATLLYLIDTMRFSYSDRFWALFPDSHREKTYVHAMRALELDPHSRSESLDYQAYRKFFLSAYNTLCEKKGEAICYAWVAQLFEGLSRDDAHKAAEETLNRELLRPLDRERISIGPYDPEPLFVNTGIRYYPEMRELVARLVESGFEVWVVSASPQWIVETAAERVGIKANRVLAIETESEGSALGDERITSRLKRVTYKEGKANAIRSMIGTTPVFGAGDSTGDIEMLTLGAGPRLLIDRGKEVLLALAKERGWLIQPPFIQRER